MSLSLETFKEMKHWSQFQNFLWTLNITTVRGLGSSSKQTSADQDQDKGNCGGRSLRSFLASCVKEFIYLLNLQEETKSVSVKDLSCLRRPGAEVLRESHWQP